MKTLLVATRSKPLIKSVIKPVFQITLATCALLGVSMLAGAQTKSIKQVVKPPVALAFIDVATSASDMPGANMMGAAAQGAQSGGGFFGALGGMAKGAMGGASDRGNLFGNTRAMGFAMGRFVDVSVYTSKNSALTEASQSISAGMNLGESLRLIAPLPDKPVKTTSLFFGISQSIFFKL